MTKISIFDFDGTVYYKDSLFEFWKFVLKKKPLRIIFLPIQLFGFLLFKLYLFRGKGFKNFFLTYLFFIDQHQLKLWIDQFWTREFPVNFRTELLERIKIHNQSDIQPVCVSASASIFIQNICETIGIDQLICSKVNRKFGFYYIDGKNCRGAEKIVRLKLAFNLNEIIITEAYSDNRDDKTLLEMAEKGVFIK